MQLYRQRFHGETQSIHDKADFQIAVTCNKLLEDFGTLVKRLLFCWSKNIWKSISWQVVKTDFAPLLKLVCTYWVTLKNMFSFVLVLGLDSEKTNRVEMILLSTLLSLSSGTRKVAALSMPSDGFHNVYSAACVLGHFASCSEHLQPHYYRKSNPQTSPRGKCLLFLLCMSSGSISTKNEIPEWIHFYK